MGLTKSKNHCLSSVSLAHKLTAPGTYLSMERLILALSRVANCSTSLPFM